MRKLFIILFLFFICGCYFPGDLRSNTEFNIVNNYSTISEPAANLPQLSIAVINSGYAESRAAYMYDGGSWFEKVNNVFVGILVKHPKGTFLFDTGLGRNISEQFSENTWLFRSMVQPKNLKSIAQQLQEHGIAESKLDFVIPSHLHWDHAGGIEDFPNTPIWIQNAELDWARTQTLPHFMPKQFDAPDIKWHYYTLSTKPYEVYSKSLDVFGDGSIILVPIEGHSPGGVGMILSFKSVRKMFFTSDCSWATEGITLPAEKSFLIMNFMKPDMDPHL